MSNIISLYDGKFSMEVDNRFKESSHPGKYILSGNIDYVYVDETSDTFITITKTDFPAPNSLEIRMNEYCSIYKRSVANLANVKLSKKTMISGKEIGLFSYTSTTTTRNLMNYVLVSSVEDKEILITLHCDIEKMAEMFLTVRNIIDSIDIL